MFSARMRGEGCGGRARFRSQFTTAEWRLLISDREFRRAVRACQYPLAARLATILFAEHCARPHRPQPRHAG